MSGHGQYPWPELAGHVSRSCLFWRITGESPHVSTLFGVYLKGELRGTLDALAREYPEVVLSGSE